MMPKEIAIFDEVLARPTDPSHPRPSLSVDLDRCSVGDLIRFRVEQEIARGDEALARLLAQTARRGAPTGAEADLNAADTKARQFAHAKSTAAVHSDAAIAAEVARAWDAFRDTQFLLFLNDRQAEDLDDEVRLTELDHVTFVRLFPLQGG